MPRAPSALLLLLLLLPPAAAAQAPAADARKAQPDENRIFATTQLAGQRVSVLPVGGVMVLDGVPEDSLLGAFRDRRAGLRRADTLLANALLERLPDITWLTPDDVRRLARRAPSLIPDADRMGQTVVRSAGLREVPDPLRNQARALAALANGRYALVPSMLVLSREAALLRADLVLVLADPRSGGILWRSVAVGRDATAEGALKRALAAVLPAALP
ncbi:MAG: hypothetical protein NW201_10535 [Gemmatimonadales bacterium]|nr:hypothetical protein [Gemmatimonadales bacterium]